MTVAELRRLLAAPELLLVDVAEAALAALTRGLLVEHPLLDDPDPENDSRILRRARIVLRQARRLRHALDGYRRVVADVLDEPDDHLPF